jgi:hypothetical protein
MSFPDDIFSINPLSAGWPSGASSSPQTGSAAHFRAEFELSSRGGLQLTEGSSGRKLPGVWEMAPDS